MAVHLILVTNRKRFIIQVMAVAGILLALAATAQSTDWTVQVDVKGGNDKPTYRILSPSPIPPSRCGQPLNTTGEDLYICQGEKVEWRIATKGGDGRYTIYQDEGFLYSSGTPRWYRGKEDLTQTGKLQTATGDPDYTYEYCVSVHDSKGDAGTKPKVYTHDPRIIVGTGNSPLVLIHKIEADCDPLIVSLKDNQDAERKAQQACAEIKELPGLLQKK